MRILVATPCAGGVAEDLHTQSIWTQIMVHPDRLPQQQKYETVRYTISNESLISRARNHMAAFAMKIKCDLLFFIDADVSFNWGQFKAVVDACDSTKGRGVVAGACPLKAYPIRLNFMPFTEDEGFFNKASNSNLKTPSGMIQMAAKHGTNLVKVPYIGTAFMCIDVRVLRELCTEEREYKFYDPNNPMVEETNWDLFPVGPIKKQFISEDWGFCHIAREIGHTVWLDTDVVVSHTGKHTFAVDWVAEAKKASLEMANK